ncbi:MAG: hypothetical protein Q7T73_00395, partial [Beijerinckiaceae bacterium]|nr:hypothetical protein [Beijerinckiaceae bacterium]
MTKPAPNGGFDQLLDASTPEDEKKFQVESPRNEDGQQVSVTSPLVGEVDAAKQRREGGVQPTHESELTPLPNPPPQGGREQSVQPGEPRGHNDPRGNGKKHGGQQMRRDKRDVHGWVVLDKPIGMTSTHAVAVIKRLFKAKRAVHAGTLDPLASGGLP